MSLKNSSRETYVWVTSIVVELLLDKVLVIGELYISSFNQQLHWILIQYLYNSIDLQIWKYPYLYLYIKISKSKSICPSTWGYRLSVSLYSRFWYLHEKKSGITESKYSFLYLHIILLLSCELVLVNNDYWLLAITVAIYWFIIIIIIIILLLLLAIINDNPHVDFLFPMVQDTLSRWEALSRNTCPR